MAELPPLPEPTVWTLFPHSPIRAYTADQIQAFAREAVKQEREQCAKVIEDVGPKDGALALVTQGFAAAIRARSSMESKNG